MVATEQEMLHLLAAGTQLESITSRYGWPSRQVHLFASRHGYLFGADGIPYQPVYPPRARTRHVPQQRDLSTG